jgi:hypothetical protein
MYETPYLDIFHAKKQSRSLSRSIAENRSGAVNRSDQHSNLEQKLYPSNSHLSGPAHQPTSLNQPETFTLPLRSIPDLQCLSRPKEPAWVTSWILILHPSLPLTPLNLLFVTESESDRDTRGKGGRHARYRRSRVKRRKFQLPLCRSHVHPASSFVPSGGSNVSLFFPDCFFGSTSRSVLRLPASEG